MKNFKKLIALGTIVGVLGVVGVAGASTASIKTPAEIVASLTGKSVEQVITQRAEGKTYGTIANEAGKLTEFQAQTLEQKKALLQQRVSAGSLTQTQADAAYEMIKARQAICDGTGRTGMGRGNNRGSGMGLGNGSGFRSGVGGGFCW